MQISTGCMPYKFKVHVYMMAAHFKCTLHLILCSRIVDLIGPKLEDLMNEIGAVIPSKWRDVGVQLGVAPGVLDGIQRQNAEKPRSCQVSFEQVFNEWRLQGSKTTYTWTHIISILRRPAIGENDLAETLATKFK